MVFIDIHCHLDFYNDKKIEKIVENAKKTGVGIIINNSVNKKSTRKSLILSKKYPEVKTAAGFYPTDALKLPNEEINKEIKFIVTNKEKITAIGEVGIDLKEKTRETLEKQKNNFKKFIELAIFLDKPIIVHSRKAEKEVIKILENYNYPKTIMHCFSGKIKLVKRIIDNKWFLTVPTNSKHSEQFQNIIRLTPIEQLFCETDSPFLHPNKEKNNEPANVIESYKKIAEIKNLDLKKVEKIIENNYKKIFR